MARDPVRQAVDGYCPICARKYSVENNRTKHHIFPRYWYGNKGKVQRLKNGISVLACHQCHEVEFNRDYPMLLNNPWTKQECLINWFKFCLSKGKNPLKIYPYLNDLII